jgi:hypothetical protein
MEAMLLLPRWKGLDGVPVANPLNKRCPHRPLPDVGDVSLLSAGRGVEGKLGGGFNSSGEGWWRWNIGAATVSFCALVSGALQRRTDTGVFHRPASASYGRKATLLNLYFPETKQSEGKINSSSHDAGPSGSSPAPVSVLWRRKSTETSIRCGAQLEGPDCFFLNLSRFFFCKKSILIQNSPVL